MKKIRYNIATMLAKSVMGYEVAPGLAVRSSGRRRWGIDHLPSGKCVPYIQTKTRSLAIQAAEEIATWMDWSQDESDIVDPEYTRKIIDKLKALRNWIAERESNGA